MDNQTKYYCFIINLKCQKKESHNEQVEATFLLMNFIFQTYFRITKQENYIVFFSSILFYNKKNKRQDIYRKIFRSSSDLELNDKFLMDDIIGLNVHKIIKFSDYVLDNRNNSLEIFKNSILFNS